MPPTTAARRSATLTLDAEGRAPDLDPATYTGSFALTTALGEVSGTDRDGTHGSLPCLPRVRVRPHVQRVDGNWGLRRSAG